MIPVDDAHRPATFTLLLALALVSTPALAGPTVVPTAEGQIGEMAGAGDKIVGPLNFESIRRENGDLIFGHIRAIDSTPPVLPEFQFLTDMIHEYPDPVPVGATATLFGRAGKETPASSWSRTAADDGDFVAFSFAVDGMMPETITVRIATYDENGTSLVQVPVIEDIGTFSVPEPTFSKTGVAVDNQGRVTVAYTEFGGGLPMVKGIRIDAGTGTIIDSDFVINDSIHADPDVALLDPAGNRLIVATNELVGIPLVRGNIVDFSGGTPVVLPEFPINSTPVANLDINPAVAADPATGTFTVAWEHFDDMSGNPVDVRARRFDAVGNPIGDDFIVNTSTANAQGQQTVAYGPQGLSAIAWAGDSLNPNGPEDLDVFLQVYDPMGNPIGGEIQVNTFTDDLQDRPAVRFLPNRDGQGRPQVAVVWRDVDTADGGGPRGTGTSYRCFAIEGFDQSPEIFADGFESGDTSAWSDTQP